MNEDDDCPAGAVGASRGALVSRYVNRNFARSGGVVAVKNELWERGRVGKVAQPPWSKDGSNSRKVLGLRSIHVCS